MVPAGNALGVLNSPPRTILPPLKTSGIKNRCNAVDGTFYNAIKIQLLFNADHTLILGATGRFSEYTWFVQQDFCFRWYV